MKDEEFIKLIGSVADRMSDGVAITLSIAMLGIGTLLSMCL